MSSWLSASPTSRPPSTFYSRLFDTIPAKRRPGYANFAIAEPPLKLVLLEGEPGEPTRMDHLGVEVPSTDEVAAATNRLADAGLATRVEDNTPAATPSRTRCGSPAPAASRGRSTPSRATPAPTSRARPSLELSDVAGDGTCCATDAVDETTTESKEKQPAAACC